MESSSPTLCYPSSTSPSPSIGENSVDKNMPEHVRIGMSYEDYAMMINPLVYDPFLDWIVHFQKEHPIPDRSFWLETVELRGAGEEPGEIILVNHIPTLWIDKNVPLIPDDLPHPTLHITSRLTHLVLIENIYNGPDMIIDGNFFPFFWRHGQRIALRTTSYYDEPLASVYEGAGLAFPVQSYHQTPQIPVHHQGFEIFVRNSTTFNQSVIDIWNAAVPNDTIDPFVVEMYVKYPGMYEHLEGDIICQPGENEYLYAHYCHTRLAPYGDENQFAVSDILPQRLWNELMDARWRRIWKRKNPWYDAWKIGRAHV